MTPPLNRGPWILRRAPVLLGAVLFFAQANFAASPPTSAPAVRIQIAEDSLLRGLNGKFIKGIGRLARGSVVEIPDRYLQKKPDGSLDLDRTTLTWLQEAGQGVNQPGLRQFDSRRREYYFPVKVVRYARGSRQAPNGELTYLALRSLIRKGALIEAEQGSPLYSEAQISEARKAYEEPGPPESDWQDEAAQKVIPSHDRTESPPPKQLSQELSAALNKKEELLKSAIQLYRKPKYICGIPRRRFLKRVNDEGEKAGIPRGLLVRLMFLESAGVCLRRGDWDSKRKIHLSRGLFQVHENTKRANVAWCSGAQETQMKKFRTWREYERGPRCLSNPVLNLAEAIHILKQKKKYLEEGMASQKGTPRSQTTLSTNNLHTWRLVLSAYNGGQRYVLDAQQRLKEFNKAHGALYATEKWEDLKLFYFDAWLQRGPASIGFKKSSVRRSRKNTITNVGYVDSLLPPGINFGTLALYEN